jgi:hypothetical protein
MAIPQTNTFLLSLGMKAGYIRQSLHQDPNTVLHSTPDTITVQNNANILVTESHQIIYSTGNVRIT